MALQVFPLSCDLQALFQALAEDYRRHDPHAGAHYIAAAASFPEFVRACGDDERGIDLPADRVACSHRYLVEHQAIVGIVRVRHSLSTPYLVEEAGHIGYDVPPAWRGQGYGTRSLWAGLQESARLGLKRVLICADVDNVPSWRTIERCKGKLEIEKMSTHYGKPFRRYWIDVPDHDVATSHLLQGSSERS